MSRKLLATHPRDFPDRLLVLVFLLFYSLYIYICYLVPCEIQFRPSSPMYTQNGKQDLIVYEMHFTFTGDSLGICPKKFVPEAGFDSVKLTFPVQPARSSAKELRIACRCQPIQRPFVNVRAPVKPVPTVVPIDT